MKIKKEVLEVLSKAAVLLNEPDLPSKFTEAISSKTDMSWVQLAGTILPIAISSVENSKLMMSSEMKATIVNQLVLPFIKDKLPWYVKPFAAKLLGWIIDLIVSSLNKLFTKKWKDVKAEPLAEEAATTDEAAVATAE